MKAIVVVLWIVMIGCKKQSAEQKYISYIDDPEHNITQKIKIGEIQTTAKLLPADYRRLKEKMRDGDRNDPQEEGLYFFDIRFDKPKGDKPEKEKLLYLDFEIQKDFVLLEGRDSTMPLICQKIENGIGGSYQYILVFEKNDKNEVQDLAVIYNDKMFGIGTLAFVYKQKDILKIPNLKPEKANETFN